MLVEQLEDNFSMGDKWRKYGKPYVGRSQQLFLRCYISLIVFIYNLFNRAISSYDYLQRRMAGC
jgi:hypothetical protein